MLDVEMWKRFMSTVNASVGGNSFVDLYCSKRGDPRMKLVIFGSNPEEWAGEFYVCLRFVDDNVLALHVLMLVGMVQ